MEKKKAFQHNVSIWKAKQMAIELFQAITNSFPPAPEMKDLEILEFIFFSKIDYSRVISGLKLF